MRQLLLLASVGAYVRDCGDADMDLQLDGVLLAGSPSEADVTGASCDEVIATLCVLDCAVEKCADGCEAAYCAVPIAELGALLATGGVRWCYGDAPCPVGVWERDDLTVAHACPVACGRRGVACGPVCFPKPDSASWAGAHTLQGCGDVDFQIMYGGAERLAGDCCPGLRDAPRCCGQRSFSDAELAEADAPTRASAPRARRADRPAAPTRRPSAADAANSCRWADDGECDEPEFCAVGSDARDCARTAPPTAAPTPSDDVDGGAPPRGGAVAVAAVLLASAVRP
ncbi:hypothetical protein SO694_000910103 [Aureococcus anophagefferens]|uniref:Uncharacterized protein n=1 Tax=Aureococcus anophagefferens TaxID=44056 RepID=A0ABR1FRY4_AURAN